MTHEDIIDIDPEEYKAALMVALDSMHINQYANTREEQEVLRKVLRKLEEESKPVHWRVVNGFPSYEMNPAGDIRLIDGDNKCIPIHTVRSLLPIAIEDLYWVDLVHPGGSTVKLNWNTLYKVVWFD